MKSEFENDNDPGKKIINELCEELGYEWDKENTLKILMSVLNAIRNRLNVEESVALLRILPASLKAFYVDGWKVKQRISKNGNDFTEEVMEMLGVKDLRARSEVRMAIESVLCVIRRHVVSDRDAEVVWLFPHEMDYVLEDGEPLFI